MCTRRGGRTPRRGRRDGRRRHVAGGPAVGPGRTIFRSPTRCSRHTSRVGRRSGSTRSCEVTRAACWRVTLTRGRGCSTRSPTWTLATPTGYRRHWNVRVRATAATCGSSSTVPSPRPTPGHSVRRCCGRRCRRGLSWISPATTGSSRPRTTSPRPGSGTSSPCRSRASPPRAATHCSSIQRRWSRGRTSGHSSRRWPGCHEMRWRSSQQPCVPWMPGRRSASPSWPVAADQPRRR